MAIVSSVVGRLLARYLSKPVVGLSRAATSDAQTWAAALRPADILLVEGNTRVSTAVKYLTQSAWSHAALYIGDALGDSPGEQARVFVEADLVEGVRAVPLSEYRDFHTRICRAVGLTDADRERVIAYVVARLGYHYDLKNVIDLARYLLPTPPVPTPWRRRMIALGSGEPTRAICSTLIAQAFQSVRYPILPYVTTQPSSDPGNERSRKEILHIRHYSLFAPRDFDISPYFAVIKPRLEAGFDYKSVTWADRDVLEEPASGGPKPEM